ncbi:MAG: hypothetical protein ACKPBA_08200, partial [Planctomycetota bacterium]
MLTHAAITALALLAPALVPDGAEFPKETRDRSSMYGLSWFGGDPPMPRPAFEESLTIRSENGVARVEMHL